jgi:hypothetical protein
MFSISSNEFSDLSEFVNKIKASSLEKSEFDTIRTWCAERGYLLHFSKTESSDVFYTLKYDRAKLTAEQYSTVGRLRSVVFDAAGRICSIAPPKMLALTDDMKTHEVNSVSGTLTAEELVEGIMVNLFWKAGTGADDSNGKWYIATKSCVGEVSYDHILQAEAEAQVAAAATVGSETTTEAGAGADAGTGTETDTSRGFQKLGVQEILRRRICEVLSLLPGRLAGVPKEYCYSFVIQHPKNQIVNTITVQKLYLVAVYQLTSLDDGGVNAIRINRDIFSANFGGSVSHMPSTLTCVLDDTETEAATATATATFTPHTVDDYCKMYASADTRSISLPGVVFVDKDSGFCYKKRNPKYESVKKRKGMEQKLMAQYLQLRKDRAIDEYLKYHPQHSRAFRQFRDRLHDYTQRLYDAYIEHYVKKDAKPLKEYDRELKTHMYKLHYDTYLATMKEAGAFITKHVVINYVNQLAAAQQLACLNATPASTVPVIVARHDADAETQTQRNNHAHSHTDSEQKHRTFQKKPIERSNSGSAEAKSGFRSARPARGGRMVPTLTVQIPRVDDSHSLDNDADNQVKGAKPTGSVKVHNRFAGLEVD